MNIKKSIRIIFRNKTYSLLNIIGLIIGITSAALIFLWAESKINFNKDIPNSQNIYIAGKHYKNTSGEYETYFETNNELSKILNDEFPEVKQSTRFKEEKMIFTVENTIHSFEESGAYVDITFLEMMDIKIIKGTSTSIFNPLNPIVISQSMAWKIYGSETPVGRGLIHEGRMYEITGIFEDLPANTSFKSDWLIPFRVLEKDMGKKFSINEWGTSWMETYVQLVPHTDLDQLNEKLKLLPAQKAGPGYVNTHNFLYPINRILLYGEFKNGVETGKGYIKTISLFCLIGVLILAIACINFMNLSTARSQKRALEVGVRKTFGTKRKYLIRQFITESALITIIALLFSIGLTWICLPFFNDLIDTHLTLDLTNPFILTGLIGIGIFCTFFAGSYPALYLSAFTPLTILKMQKISKVGNAARIRQGLVIFQFSMSFILICITYIIYLQIHLAQSRDIGIEKENLITFLVTNELRDSYSAVLNEIKNTGLVKNCGFSGSSLLYAEFITSPWYWDGKDPEDDISIPVFFITEGLIEAAGIKLIDGTDLSPKRNSEGKKGILINEALAKRMGEEGRIGGKIGQSSDNKYGITGIVKNFIFDDPYAIESGPAMFLHNPSRATYLYIRLKPEVNAYEAIGNIQSVLKNFTPSHLFEATFMSSSFNKMLENENLIKKLSGLFATLSIIISCLGLLGLSAFSAEQRTKEIGIRKVLGAKIKDIIVMLNKSYMVLLLISFVISIPISLYIANRYLQDFAYRIFLSWNIFAGVALLITFIALLTVSFQSLKAAIANPAKSIKTE